MRKKTMKIYHSRVHLAITLIVVALPFLTFLLLSRIAAIPVATLFRDLGISVGRLAIAYFAAAALAWIGAIAFYRGRRAAIALPIFDVLQSFPPFAALPLATYFLGASERTIFFFLFLAVLWPLFFSITSSLKLIRHDWEEVVEISSLSGFDYLRRFLLPVSVPGLITGSIIGLGDGWEALVVTEIIVRAPAGLGNFFTLFAQSPAITAFGIFGFLILIFSVNKLVWLPLLEWSHRIIEE